MRLKFGPGRHSGSGRIAILVAHRPPTLIPVWVAALRAGLRHLIPVGDTAIMALHAPSVLSAHPPLVGMPASSASGATHVVHFPAAWQLYWLALPVKLLGPTWGTVTAMAALNTIWIVLAIWLVCRNLETLEALAVIALLGAFCWSIGAGMLIDSWPLKMMLIPFLLVVIAAWFTAAGDRAALVVLAIAANYAWLDHLVLAVVVPVVAFVGVVGLLAGHLRAVRADPAGRPQRARSLRLALAGAAAVTVVMWLPALIQQFTTSPGNLGLLMSCSGGGPPPIHSPSAALHVVASVTARPPFWFRGTLTDPTFYRAHHTGFAFGSATWFDVAAACIVAALLGGAVLVCLERRDRTGLALVATAAAAVVGSVVTVYAAPATTALVPEYLFSVWVTAFAVWMAVIVVALRCIVPRRVASRRVVPRRLAASSLSAVVCALVLGVLNLPTSPTGYTADTEENVLARQMSATVISRLGTKGPVAVTMGNLFGNADYVSALLVEFQRHGIAFCYPVPNTSLYEFIPDCGTTPTTRPTATLVIADQPDTDPPPGTVLFRERIFPATDTAAIAGLDRRIRTWLRAQSSLRLTGAAQHAFLGTMIPNQLRSQTRSFEPVGGNLGRLADDDAFQKMIVTWWRRSDARNAALFVGQPVSPAELYRWASVRRDAALTLWVTRR